MRLGLEEAVSIENIKAQLAPEPWRDSVILPTPNPLKTPQHTPHSPWVLRHSGVLKSEQELLFL